MVNEVNVNVNEVNDITRGEQDNNGKPITIVDSIMSSGKTQTFINYMNENEDKKFIYITPYLSEVERIKSSCPNRRFYDPVNRGNGKLDSFNRLLLNGKDIVSTHALFKTSTEETRELIQSNGYTLILDEVMNVLQEIKLNKDDLKTLLDLDLILVEDNGLVSWNEDKIDYSSRYNDIKLMCKNKSIFLVNSCLFMWTFPVNIFTSFEEVFVLTYLFKGQIQKYYYDLYDIKYSYVSVRKNIETNKYEICDFINDYDMTKIRDLINILDEDKLNVIGEDKYALSKTWFTNKRLLVKQLQKNTYNFFNNKCKSKCKESLWVTFKDCRKEITGNGYARSFLSLGTRATNDYIDRKNLAYCANVFLNPMIVHFFNQHKVSIDEDTYALSELIQWVYRSRIRINKEINLYIPSSRMRNLLIKWLK